MTCPSAEVAIFGGTGFYSFLDDTTEVSISTPYGEPSDRITIGVVGDRRVAFLPRHGRDHTIPPHLVNYAANLWAMRDLGVERVLGPCAVGSLDAAVHPGDIVVCDQFVDRTWGRRSTYYDGPVTTHVSLADPYCPQLRELIVKTATELTLPVHETGTMVVIQGPRFSTRAESSSYAASGCTVVNMTGVPEATFARELELCYANISLVTDYDVGVSGDDSNGPVTHVEVRQVLASNQENLRKLLLAMVSTVPGSRTCACGTALAAARFSNT
jgi:5'-methylthioadenosine phosphorylase